MLSVNKKIYTQKEKKRRRKIKNSIGERIFDVANVIFMIILSCIMIYPMWYVLCASFSSVTRLSAYNGFIFAPLNFNVQAYKMMFKHPLIVRSYFNSIFLVVMSVTISIVFTSICAYILSRKNVLWNKFLNIMVLFTMFFGGGMIPTYLIISQILKMNNSYWALVLPGAISVYNMIIMRTSFEAIPTSLEEAAKLDGAGHWRILFSVVVPLSKAIIAVMVLYYAVGVWNAWFDASIYLHDRNKFPLQLILREILISNDTTSLSNASAMDQEAVGELIKYSTIVFATVPILCVYPFLQKYFTKGVMIGAVKG